jgi:hypothetical protein
MVLVDFEELQLLSGYKQVSKVISFLRDNKIRFVLGGDGRPRTTNDMLKEDLTDEKATKPAEIRFT